MARQLADIQDYGTLHTALRARADELDISRLTVDEVAGLPVGYTGKLLGPKMVKKFGPISLGPVLRVLGVKLVMVEDAEAITALSGRLPKKERRARRSRISAEFCLLMGKFGQRGARALNDSLSPEARRRSAQRAARARWKNRSTAVAG